MPRRDPEFKFETKTLTARLVMIYMAAMEEGSDVGIHDFLRGIRTQDAEIEINQLKQKINNANSLRKIKK